MGNLMIKLKEFNENKLNKLFRENFRIIAPSYIKLLSEWMNSSYETFHDIDKYRIILYLINKDFEQYIKTNKVESYDNFFFVWQIIGIRSNKYNWNI